MLMDLLRLIRFSCLVAATAAVAVCADPADNILLDRTDPRGGWKGFGMGFDDAGVNLKENEIVLHATWSNSTWGVGMKFDLRDTLDGRTVRAVRFRVRTENGSRSRVYAGLSTVDGASVEISRKRALEIGKSWQIVDFPVSEMVYEEPDLNSRMFTDGDWKNIKSVKLLFTKPDRQSANQEKIIIRRPELVLNSE